MRGRGFGGKGGIWKELGEGKLIRIYCVKQSIFNKKGEIEFISHTSEGWKVYDQGTALLETYESLLLGSYMVSFHCILTCQKEQTSFSIL